MIFYTLVCSALRLEEMVFPYGREGREGDEEEEEERCWGGEWRGLAGDLRNERCGKEIGERGMAEEAF